MSFDFSKIEGLEPELVEQLNANDVLKTAIGGYVDKSVDARVEVKLESAKSEFKSKMDALGGKLTAAQEQVKAFEGIDPKEINVLKSAKNEAPELKAQLEELRKSYDLSVSEAQESVKKLQDMQLSDTITQSINAYNAKNTAVSVKPEVMELIVGLAKKRMKVDPETNQTRVYDSSGNVMATNEGAATPQDLLSALREEYPPLFNSPTGSGASGTQSTSGSASQMSRSKFDALPAHEKATAATKYTITEE